MKIACLFRGPLRPNPERVAGYSDKLLRELRDAGHEVDAYLATWLTYKEYHFSQIVPYDLYGNYIVQPEPPEEIIRRYVKRKPWYGYYGPDCVFKMYYQTKCALDIIVNTNVYDRIIHSRTDLNVVFGRYLNDWLECQDYASPRTREQYINDQLGIATPDIMYKSWNYDTLQQLGVLMDKAHIPENIVMQMQSNYGIRYVQFDAEEFNLDPDRNS